MSTTTTASTATATCNGCGNTFKGARGLASHQNHRNAKTSCRSDAARAELSKPYVNPAEPIETGLGSYLDKAVPLYDGVPTGETPADEDQAAIDAEPYSDARLEAALAEHFEECAREAFTLGEDEDEDEGCPGHESLAGEHMGESVYCDGSCTAVATSVGTIANGKVTFEELPPVSSLAPAEAEAAYALAETQPGDRDALIEAATIYTSIPEGVQTALIKIDGRDKWAQRMASTDVQAIAATAFSSSVVRITKHEAGGETVVTDFHWLDGVRARVTEKFAI